MPIYLRIIAADAVLCGRAICMDSTDYGRVQNVHLIYLIDMDIIGVALVKIP